MLAAWLTATYDGQIKLHGILYLHRITDVRLGGSAKRNMRMFQKLCGSNELQNVILATTMWTEVARSDAIRRETELMETQDFWGCMVECGSRVERHMGDVHSAQRLIGMFLKSDRRDGPTEMTLAIQKEMVEDEMSLQDTQAAGEVLETINQRSQGYRKEMEALRLDMRRAEETQDVEWQRELEDRANELRRRHEETERSEKTLVTTSEQLMKRTFEDKIEESAVDRMKRVLAEYRRTRGNPDEKPRSERPPQLGSEPPFSESVDTPQSSLTDPIERPELPPRNPKDRISRPPSVDTLQSSLTDPIKRPELPPRKPKDQISRPPSVTSSQLSLLRFQRTAHARRPVGSYWPKLTRRHISLSLRGHHCSFTGPVHSKSCVWPAGFCLYPTL